MRTEQHWYKQGAAALKKRTTLVSIRGKTKALKLQAQQIIKRKKRARQTDDQAAVIVMLMEYVLLQLARLNQFIKGPNDLLAYTTRNLLECSIWCELVKTDSTAIEHFYDDGLIEERELLPLDNPNVMAKYHDISDLTERLKSLKKVGIDPEDLVRALQKRVLTVQGSRTQLKKRRYKQFEHYIFTWCSKHIHPSAWLLLGLTEVLTDDLGRRILLEYGLEYADECIKQWESAT